MPRGSRSVSLISAGVPVKVMERVPLPVIRLPGTPPVTPAKTASEP